MVIGNVCSGRAGFRKILRSMPVLQTGTFDGADETSQGGRYVLFTCRALIPDLNQLPKFDDDEEGYDSSEDNEGSVVNGNGDTDGDDDPDDSDNDDSDKDLFDDDDNDDDDEDLKPSSSDDDDDYDGSDEDDYDYDYDDDEDDDVVLSNEAVQEEEISEVAFNFIVGIER